MQLQKWLIITGCVLIMVGLCLPWIIQLGLGKLPGDIYIKKDRLTFYFPIVTSLLVSIVISLIIWLFNR